MEDILVYPAGYGKAAFYAADFLNQYGIPVTDHPTPDATHLLLDVPTKEIPTELLERLPENITVIGGNLDRPELTCYKTIDLLRREAYLARNAAITAECALQIAANEMDSVVSATSVLVIGWGRIGKCLASLLKNIGCNVTVAARKESDRAILEALGYNSIDPQRLNSLRNFTLIYTTVPQPVLSSEQLTFSSGCIKIDLASRQGLNGKDVIWARGLPGQYAPKSSGKLIADILVKEVLS